MCAPLLAAGASAVSSASAAVSAMSTMQMLSLGISAATGIMGYFNGKSRAEVQEKSLEYSYNAQLQDNRARANEINSSALAEKSDVAREALIRKGQLRVATGEAGLQGLLVDSLMQDVDAQTGRAMGRVEENRRRGIKQIGRDNQSAYASAQSRANQIEYPSLATTAAGVAGDALGIISSNPLAKNQTKTTKNASRNVAQNGGR